MNEPNPLIPIIVEWEGKPVVEIKHVLDTDKVSQILDKSWAKQAFLVKKENLDPVDIKNRGFSSAWFKFTDTTLGGAMCINPRPQFTRYADIREKGRLAGRVDVSPSYIQGNHGMGRYYSEALDDNYQIVNMRFGVPQFNSLTKFFTGFYNQDAATLAKTGRTKGFFGTAGQVVGWVASVIVWPLITAGHLFNFFFRRNTSKFYYLKPTMLVYWGAVNGIVNGIAVKSGLLPSSIKPIKDQQVGTTMATDDFVLKSIYDMIPGVVSEDGGYDMYAAANKAQRMAHMLAKTDYDQFNSEGSEQNFMGYLKKSEEAIVNHPRGENTFMKRLQMWLGTEPTIPEPEKTNNAEPNVKIDPPDSLQKGPFPNKFQDYLNAELNDGAAFASFRVDYSGGVSESFSNTVGESDLASKINSMSSQGRSANFSFAGGNLIGGAIGAVVGGALDAAKSFAAGIGEQFGMSGLASFAGAAFVDIPKHWQSSVAQLPRVNYTMQLISPYGNLISRMQNIYIPMAMLLAGALPLSTGKQSYSSPFILEMYDRGRCQTRLGMIDSLQFTRGTGNLGFNNSNQALCVDVSFSVVDMSSVMHMPISKGILVNDNDGMFDDETVYEDYIAVLASQGIFEQLYTIPKLKLRFAKQIRKFETLTSPAAWAMMIHQETIVGKLSVLYRGSDIIR